MLFDLRSPGRRRIIKVIYATLALLMGGGLVLFGIGSDVQGGLFDAFGDDQGSSEASSQLDDQAQRIEVRLRRDPENEELLLALVRTRYSAGNAEVTVDPATGQQSFGENAFVQFEQAADAWERYIKLDPAEPKALTANLAAQAAFYAAANAQNVGQFTDNIETALGAQEVFAEARPSVNAYTSLAQFAYYAGDFEAGDRAAEKAKEEAPKGFKQQVTRAVESYRKEGRRIKKQLEAAAKRGKSSLESPFGGLGGAGGGSSGLAPTAP